MIEKNIKIEPSDMVLISRANGRRIAHANGFIAGDQVGILLSEYHSMAPDGYKSRISKIFEKRMGFKPEEVTKLVGEVNDLGKAGSTY